jgi:4-hydroxybenzoate polyprenyltransferase
VTTPSPHEAPVLLLPPRRTPVQAAVASLRPRQWTKNLLVYAGIVFAAELADPARWLQATVAFIAYCAASSAAYLVNDVRDAAEDRLHPFKRSRPVARGELRPREAVALAAALAATAFALTAVLGLVPLLFLAGFATLQLGYSLRLKHVVLIDVMTIGGLFVTRAAAGAAAVDVRISPWLLLCTALLALFLGLAKRRGELVLVGADGAPGRPVLEGYSLELVDQLVAVVAASTVIAYSLYTFTADEQTPWMMVTIPFVLFGIFRYLLLVHRRDLGEEPEAVLLSDVPILVCVGLWTLTAAVILTLA